MSSKTGAKRENPERVTALQLCCPNCGSDFITTFESPGGEWSGGVYHAWQECVECQTTFTTILHPVWLEDVDVPKTREEASRRRQKHIDQCLIEPDSGMETHKT